MSVPGAAMVVHSGGPTSVINASLLGVVEEARRHTEIGALYGARFGIEGILNEEFVDLFRQSERTLAEVADAPSSALGTSRRDAGDQDLERMLAVLRAYNIRYLFYTGGNGSMAAAGRIAAAARDAGRELFAIGIPKTIDNDLEGTDHTPGYASAARFFATAARDIGADNRALPGQVVFVEVLGRNAGWITAATSLARRDEDDAPHLIYLPERRLPLDQLLADVEGVYRRLGRAVVAVCEGQLDERGEPFGADVRAGSRGTLARNLAHRLALLVEGRLGIRARSEKPGLFGRSNRDLRSEVDWDEARLCGRAAVRAACEGASGVMVALVRQPGPAYSVETELVPLERAAAGERLFPTAWIDPRGNDVLPAFREYALPLTGEIAHFASLDLTLRRGEADIGRRGKQEGKSKPEDAEGAEI